MNIITATKVLLTMGVDGPIHQGIELGEFIADVHRPDVNVAMNVTGDHGYRISIDSMNIIDDQDHSLYVYAHDSRGLSELVELAGSPLHFNLTP